MKAMISLKSIQYEHQIPVTAWKKANKNIKFV